MKYGEWLATVDEAIKQVSLWRMEVYRTAFLLSDIAWGDVTKLFKDKRTVSLSDQLYRATGSVSANIAEGYSRNTDKERARFYSYALGSAREACDWYFKARHILGPAITSHRIKLLTEIIRQLLVIIPKQRTVRLIKESSPIYKVNEINILPNENILADIPQ